MAFSPLKRQLHSLQQQASEALLQVPPPALSRRRPHSLATGDTVGLGDDAWFRELVSDLNHICQQRTDELQALKKQLRSLQQAMVDAASSRPSLPWEGPDSAAVAPLALGADVLHKLQQAELDIAAMDGRLEEAGRAQQALRRALPAASPRPDVFDESV